MLMRAPYGTITDVAGVEVVRLRRLGWEPVLVAPPTTTTGEDTTVPPPLSASKAQWVEYANQLDLDVSGMSKAQIVEKLG